MKTRFHHVSDIVACLPCFIRAEPHVSRLKWRDNANNFEVKNRVFLSYKKYKPTFLDKGRQTKRSRAGNKTTNSRFSSKPEIESTPRICLARKEREKFRIVRANFVLAECGAFRFRRYGCLEHHHHFLMQIYSHLLSDPSERFDIFW